MPEVAKTKLENILYLRDLFLQENNFQIRYNARHERGWTDSYLITYNGQNIGYGSVAGFENHTDRNDVFEFYIIPTFRRLAPVAFIELLQASKSIYMECQTNDVLLTQLVYEYGQNIKTGTVLLGEHTTTALSANNAIFRKRTDADTLFEHKAEPEGAYVLELNNRVIATGDFLLHYNIPFADLYMEVEESYCKQGYGSYLIQELKKECYLHGRVPAARTGTNNTASRATLIKAGLKVVGYMLSAEVKQG